MQRQMAVSSAVFLVLLSASGVAAQETGIQVAVVAPQKNGQDDRIKREAEALYSQPSRFYRAAKLHEQEAATRIVSDPLRVEALASAARLYTYSGQAQKGCTLMTKAARQALGRGDVARAAHAFIDAAFMAMREGDRQLVDDLTHEAAMLALSPLLSVADRVAIQRRIDPSRVQLCVRPLREGIHVKVHWYGGRNVTWP